MKYIFFLFTYFVTYSQNITILGYVYDNQNRSIKSASVIVLDDNQNTVSYSFTSNDGKFILNFKQPKELFVTICVASLGYFKKEQKVNLSRNNLNLRFELLESNEILKEVVIEASQKIKVNRDTTTIQIASFGNKTEQTVEDILKRLPGIEVKKDGSIEAHGKPINKLLIEGEDLLDKNYKLLSKNLDSKVLDAVQILDNFEDNPILKKLSNSQKVAINLKLKKDKQNIWFGNIQLGSGILSENRWKEGINLGLLKKKIKFFYLADYNNLGDKATDLITKSINSNSNFGESRIEKTTQNLFSITSNENSTFSKSQSVFNNAFFNSLTFNKYLTKKIKVRGVGYFANDLQKQNSFSETIFNFGANSIFNSETNLYQNKKTLTSGELELKYFANDKNYFTNVLIYKNNPNRTNADLIYNSSILNQESRDENETFYNHLNHTTNFFGKNALNTYLYFGSDYINQKSKIVSPLLNQFLGVNQNSEVSQFANNSLKYFGIKSKLIYKFNKIEHVIGLGIENNAEILNNYFFINSAQNNNLENYTNYKKTIFSFENTLKYKISKYFEILASLDFNQTQLNRNSVLNSVTIFNPNITLFTSPKKLGNFNLSYSENSFVPEINFLTNNTQLIDYRTFRNGTDFLGLPKNRSISVSHSLFNDIKRFSISTFIYYFKTEKTFNNENIINNNFSFESYLLSKGGESYNCTFKIVNYFRKLKISTKLETSQNWSFIPTKVNSINFETLNSYNSNYRFSATSYFNLPINFDLGVNYNYSQSTFNKNVTKNNIYDAFVNVNYKISESCTGELNSTFYKTIGNNYAFVNAIVNYNPEQCKFSYRLILNNLSNENEFTNYSLNNYTSYKSRINLVPRYLLMSVKYRF